jgi:hypothetical protein
VMRGSMFDCQPVRSWIVSRPLSNAQRRQTWKLLGVFAFLLSACSTPQQAQQEVTAEPSWNPCTSIKDETVYTELDSNYTIRRGTATNPECTFVPSESGEAVVDVNYLISSGSLTGFLESAGNAADLPNTRLKVLSLPGADEAQLIVSISDDTLFVTGAVRDGQLVQIANAIDPSPFDRRRLVKSVEGLLRVLTRGSDDSGLTN